jgi:hypothetical protein
MFALYVLRANQVQTSMLFYTKMALEAQREILVKQALNKQD